MFLQNISKFISNYRYEQATVESITTVKAAFLDFFGVTYRGSVEDASNIAFNTVEEIFSGNLNLNLKASVVGRKTKTSILSAAFLNGVAAHVLELDDGHRGAQIHLGAVIFPTALAIAESHDLSGKDFLEGVIVGYEVGILLGKLVNPEHRNKGFHTTGTIGTFIAGAVASKLLKLDEKQILNALGLCGTQAAGLLESDHGGSMGKALHAGKASYNGLLSALLARNGFTGSETIFEGDEGFLKTMVYDNTDFDQDNFSFENALKEVGKVRVRDIYFKKYPFCRHLHSSIDTALKLKASIGDEYDHIENVAVKTYEIAAEHDNFNPKNLEELKQSLPYAVAISLVVGEVSVDKILALTPLPIPSASRTFGASRDSSAVASSDAASALSTRAIWELWRRWATGARFPSSRLPSASCAAGLPSAAGKDPFRPPNDTTLLRSDLPWLLAAPSSHANGPFRTELKNTC